MKRSICIELLEEHPTATFYAVRFTDQSESEFDKFFNSFSSQSIHNADIHALAYWMEKSEMMALWNDSFGLREEKILKPCQSAFLDCVSIVIGLAIHSYCLPEEVGNQPELTKRTQF